MNEPPSNGKRIPIFFITVISVLLLLSFISLYQAAETYRRTGSPDLMTLILSVGAIALSSYLVLQMRHKPVKLGFEIPKIFTTVQCSKCDFKNIREFQKGDYVLKIVESCPKCQNSTYISSVYRETSKEEEKEE